MIRKSAVLLAALLVAAQDPKEERPAPDVSDVSYGPHERNVLDLWRAKSESPTPLVVFIHGGGFLVGSKDYAKAEQTFNATIEQAPASARGTGRRAPGPERRRREPAPRARAARTVRRRARPLP